MSDLFDKQVNAQTESLKPLQGLHKLLQTHEKVCDVNESRSKEKQFAST